MTRPLLLLLCVLPTLASAQTNAAKILEQGLKQAVGLLKPLSDEERQAVLNATATLLTRHVTFRPDGTASATFHRDTPWPVEWRKLVVSGIHPRPVTDADRLNGITRRYLVALACDASRNWKPKATAWSEWTPTGFLYFPSAITIEESGGALTAKGNAELPRFVPGPGPAIQEKQPAGKPSNPLPPGMTRGR